MLSKLKKIEVDYLEEYGVKPSTSVLGRLLGVSINKVIGLRKSAKIATIGSIEAIIQGTDRLTVGEMVEDEMDRHAETLEAIQAGQLQAVLWSVVDGLPGYDGQIIRMSYQEGLTTKQIGERLGCNAVKARNLLQKAMLQLKHPTRSHTLKPYMYDEDVRSQGMQGVGVGTFMRTWISATERAALGRTLHE